MIIFKKLILLVLAVSLTSCAAVSTKSQLAPGVNLTKKEALFLEWPKSPSVAHQKYLAVLDESLRENGFNLVHAKSKAKYVMRASFDDFQADLYQSVPTAQTTVQRGNIGSIPYSGTSTTIGSERAHTKIPTHNSTLTVTERTTGRAVWEASMAKSFDVYNHTSLKNMIEAMLSLYGKDGEKTEIVADKLRL